MASKTNIDFYTVCLLYKILADRRMKAYIHGIKGRHAQWPQNLHHSGRAKPAIQRAQARVQQEPAEGAMVP
jgi:hypothetical protein